MFIRNLKSLVYGVLLSGSIAVVIAQPPTPTAPRTPTEAYLQLQSSAEVEQLRAAIDQRQWERARALALQLMEKADLSSQADLHIGNLIRKLRDEDIQQAVTLAEKRFSLLSQKTPKAVQQAITLAERAEELGNLYLRGGQPVRAKELFAKQLDSFKAATRELSPSTKDEQLVELINFTERLLSAGQRRAEIQGATAPELISEEFMDMKGSDLTKQRGRIVLLDFFAHSCVPCVEDLPEIDRLSELHKGKLSAVIVASYRGYFGPKEGISRSEEKAALKQLKTEKGSKAGLLIGPQSNFKEYGIVTVPAFALIDAAGKVRTILVGASMKELQDAVDKLIKETSSN